MVHLTIITGRPMEASIIHLTPVYELFIAHALVLKLNMFCMPRLTRKLTANQKGIYI